MYVLSMVVLVFSYSYCQLAIQCIDIDEVGFIHSGMFVNKFFNHSTSLSAIPRATYSNSIVNIAIMVCLADLHVIALPQM